jgi:uncharacterized short protein YbdD (DUF466 family)
MSVWRQFVDAAQTLWQWLRIWCGDAAYERYQSAMERKRAGARLTAQEFYLQQTERRYSRPNRCC